MRDVLLFEVDFELSQAELICFGGENAVKLYDCIFHIFVVGAEIF